MGLTLCRTSAARRREGAMRRATGLPSAAKFCSAEEAWFWTMAALAARRDGTGRSGAGIARPCDPDDVIRCLDRLHQQGRIDLVHARVLRVWGERQTPPDPRHGGEAHDHGLWIEAMRRLEWPLRAKNIVD